MESHTLTGHRAITFARGLYHVAACDGVDPQEREALAAFLSQVGLPQDTALLTSPFDPAEAAQALDSAWLRRTFIQACRLMVQVDGQVSPAERDTLRALATALHVGERVALDDLDQRVDPHALVRWIRELAVDLVSWDDEVRPGWLWRFPHHAHPLAEGGAIVVEPGQALVVRDGGAQVDCLTPGEHRLTPDTLPGLAAARGWTGGPVRAELLFVRTGPSPVNRWGTTQPIQRATRTLGPIALQAFGRFSVRVCDPRQFVERFARQALPSEADLTDRARRLVAGWFEQAVLGLDLEDAALFATLEDLDALRGLVLPTMQANLARAGLSLARFAIEHLTAPLELGLKPGSSRTRTLARVAGLGLGERPDTAPVPAIAPEPGAPARREAPRAVSRVALRPCHGCAKPVPVDARFCAHCGAGQQKACHACGHKLPMNARFCAQCGTPQG